MQIKVLRHPSKGTIGNQKGTFLSRRGILLCKGVSPVIKCEQENCFKIKVMSEANFLEEILNRRLP